MNLLQQIMLKNTLRQQFNWHNRQQTQSFRKIERQNCKQSQSNACQKEGDNQLQWLEKMVNELQSYNSLFKAKGDYANTNQENRQKEERPVLADSKVVLKNNEAVLNGKDVLVKTTQMKTANQKKVKFQLIAKENMVVLSGKKKTVPGRKGLINQTIQQMPIKKQIVPTPKSSAKKSMGQTMNRKKMSSVPSSKTAELEQIKTEPYILLQTSPFAANKNKSGKERQPQDKLRDILLYGGRKQTVNHKKSVGKIVRNVQRLNQTCASVKQTWKAAATMCQKPQVQKVFIKLQTQKLQKYLVQSVIKPQSSQILKTEEFQKYCQSNQAESFKTDKRGANPPRQTTDQRSASFKQSQTSAPRSKSEQRKFNKCVEIIKPKRLFQPYAKANYTAIQIGKEALTAVSSKISNNATISEAKPQRKQGEAKLKRIYEYKQQSQTPPRDAIQAGDTSAKKKEQKVEKVQKLFTLQSMGNEHEQIKQEQQDKWRTIEQTPIQKNNCIGLNTYQRRITHEGLHPKKAESLYDTKRDRLKQLSPTRINISPRGQIQKFVPTPQFYSHGLGEVSTKGHSQQLALLFNFLDESKRGFLSEYNCGIDKLTEQLKLMFSFTLNQIKTKKKFYTLQKFIEESGEVLQIKTEVYSSHNSNSQRQISSILKSNIDILKKRYPFQFLKHTQTQSIYQPNVESKRNSVNSNVSVVVQQLMLRMNGNQKGRSPLGRLQGRGSTKIQQYGNRSIINEQQPEVFLQKKYGLRRGEECVESNNESLAGRRTRAYLQKLEFSRYK